ncbi:porin [Paraburkholderia adhaesiva]|uniref:porin n=1 Tax=Paraburkholderia adhaesiva TaxID=2883244 RepID=UPI001F2FE6F4|nr:porin [Paraburkholderia adhaesiva]
MKKRVLALSLFAIAAGAQAQSSVTLYGRIDNGLSYTNNVNGNSHSFGMGSGLWGQSWWGLQGAEDLGGGTKTIFQLESAIITTNGSLANTSSLFNRHATVGLSNDKYGTFKMGNIGDGEITQDTWGADPQEMQDFSIFSMVRGRNWAKSTSAAEYSSPTWNGFSFKAQYSLLGSTGGWNVGTGVNTAGVSAGGRTNGIGAYYTFGMGDVRVIYDEVRDVNGQFSNVFSTSRMAMVGGTLTFGPVRAYYGYEHLSAPQAAQNTATFNATTLAPGASAPTAVNYGWIGANWQVNAATAVTAGIYHSNVNNGNGNGTLFTLGSTYNLSKRTFLYVETGYAKNSSTANFSVGGNPNVGEGNGNPNFGQGQFGAIAGIFTQF